MLRKKITIKKQSMVQSFWCSDPRPERVIKTQFPIVFPDGCAARMKIRGSVAVEACAGGVVVSTC